MGASLLPTEKNAEINTVGLTTRHELSRILQVRLYRLMRRTDRQTDRRTDGRINNAADFASVEKLCQHAADWCLRSVARTSSAQGVGVTRGRSRRIHVFFTSAPPPLNPLSRERCEVYWWFCLFVRSHNSKTARTNFTKYFVHVACGRGSVLLWRHCDTLCISGFMNNVIFSYHGANGPESSTMLCLEGVRQVAGRQTTAVFSW